MDDGLVTASELTDFSSVSPDHNVTHEGLLNFPHGAADRVSLPDKDVELVRNNQVENQSTLMASAVEEIPFFWD